MKFMAPMLVVKNMEVSRRFYETLLDERVILDFGENITFSGGFSLQLSAYWAGKLLQQPESAISYGGKNFEMYYETEDFDGFLPRLKESGAEVVSPVQQAPWGQRAVRFYDPDRHIIEVGESMEMVVRRFLAEGMDPEEVSKCTMYPIEFVRHCMES